jgi:cytochrome c peroxidase
MTNPRTRRPGASVILAGLVGSTLGCGASTPGLPSFPVPDSAGSALTILASAQGHADLPRLTTPFGTNGRFCETCHSVLNGWVLTPSDDLSRFTMGRKSPTPIDGGAPLSFADNATAADNDALDPLFRIVDAATSPLADASTAMARQTAYALLFTKALIRVGLPQPAAAEFNLTAVDDPYGYASASELSLYRRTLPMTNLAFEQTIMWDGRETANAQSVTAALTAQAADATLIHAQATVAPAADVLNAMVFGELNTYFAQQTDASAGDLTSDGATGGPDNLRTQSFYPGINAFPGPDPQGVVFSSDVFTLYAGWSSSSNPARASIARGQAIFDTRMFSVTGVSGLNDDLGQTMIQATCSTCHNTPNVGTSSQGLLFDIGVADSTRRTPDMPLYTFTNSSSGELRQTTDPGGALVTGKWSYMGRFKVPGLRGLAGRAPYFHDGSAASISDVVDYFDARFQIGLTAADEADLIAFLGAL